jgi:hypothetical protein
MKNLKYIFLIFFSVSFFIKANAQEICYADSNAVKYKSAIEESVKYYSELAGYKICYKVKNIKTTASCVPVWYTLFRGRKHRTYRICINNNETKLRGAILTHATHTAQVGVLGHELGHVVDYSHRNLFGVARLGLGYIFITGRKKTEKRVDCIAIQHGLGTDLMEFSNYIFNSPNVPETYKKYKRKVYNSPDELKNVIESGTCSN